MLVDFIFNQCVSQGRLIYTLDGKTTMRPHPSHHAKTNLADLRVWIFQSFNKIVQFVDLRAILPLVDKKMVVLV